MVPILTHSTHSLTALYNTRFYPGLTTLIFAHISRHSFLLIHSHLIWHSFSLTHISHYTHFHSLTHTAFSNTHMTLLFTHSYDTHFHIPWYSFSHTLIHSHLTQLIFTTLCTIHYLPHVEWLCIIFTSIYPAVHNVPATGRNMKDIKVKRWAHFEDITASYESNEYMNLILLSKSSHWSVNRFQCCQDVPPMSRFADY